MSSLHNRLISLSIADAETMALFTNLMLQGWVHFSQERCPGTV